MLCLHSAGYCNSEFDEKAFIDMAADGSLKLVAVAALNNIASCKTLEKVGFSLIKTVHLRSSSQH